MVAEAVEALGQHAAGEDVVGRPAKHALELAAGPREVSGLDEGPPQGEARRRIVRVQGQAAASHADGLGQIPILAQLLRELREEARPGLALQPATKLVDARVRHDGSG